MTVVDLWIFAACYVPQILIASRLGLLSCNDKQFFSFRQFTPFILEIFPVFKFS